MQQWQTVRGLKHFVGCNHKIKTKPVKYYVKIVTKYYSAANRAHVLANIYSTLN